MTEDNNLFDIEEAQDVIEEAMETGSIDIDMNGIARKAIKKGMGGLIDKILYGTNGASHAEEALSARDEIRFQREQLRHQQIEIKEREKSRREDEIHTLEMEKLRLEIARIGETDAIDSNETPSTVVFGTLPSSPTKPRLESDNPEAFTEWLKSVSSSPCRIVILGSPGFGKSALGHSVLEYMHFTTGRKAVLYAPASIPRNILPSWLMVVDDFNLIPEGAVILVDEAALVLNSRSGFSQANRDFGSLSPIARQKGQSLIFVSQSSRSLDITAFTIGDIHTIWKKPSTFSAVNERKEVKPFVKMANQLFASVEKACLREYSVVFTSGEEVILMRNGLASYWSEEVSTMYRHCFGDQTQAGTIQQEPKQESKKEEILSMISKGISQQDIALKLGVSQAYVSMLSSGKR